MEKYKIVEVGANYELCEKLEAVGSNRPTAFLNLFLDSDDELGFTFSNLDGSKFYTNEDSIDIYLEDQDRFFCSQLKEFRAGMEFESFGVDAETKYKGIRRVEDFKDQLIAVMCPDNENGHINVNTFYKENKRVTRLVKYIVPASNENFLCFVTCDPGVLGLFESDEINSKCVELLDEFLDEVMTFEEFKMNLNMRHLIRRSSSDQGKVIQLIPYWFNSSYVKNNYSVDILLVKTKNPDVIKSNIEKKWNLPEWIKRESRPVKFYRCNLFTPNYEEPIELEVTGVSLKRVSSSDVYILSVDTIGKLDVKDEHCDDDLYLIPDLEALGLI